MLLKNVLFGSVFLLLLSVPAQAEGYAFLPDAGDGSMCQDMTGNWVMCSSLGETGGGNYTSCQAVGAWGQQCQDLMIPASGGPSECASVSRNGKCNCDERTKKTTGLCVYQAR